MFICSPGITQNAANLCKDLITVNLGAICQSWHKDPCKKVDPGREVGVHRAQTSHVLQAYF